MRRIVSSILIALLAPSLSAQIVLERQVISCFGLNYSGEYHLFSVAGQVEYATTPVAEHLLTQGFEQPGPLLELSASVLATHNLCDNSYAVTIVSIVGCADTSGLVVHWNGLPGGLVQNNALPLTEVFLTTQSGCAYSFVVDLLNAPVTELPCGIEFYSYFSPNNDGNNDIFKTIID